MLLSTYHASLVKNLWKSIGPWIGWNGLLNASLYLWIERAESIHQNHALYTSSGQRPVQWVWRNPPTHGEKNNFVASFMGQNSDAQSKIHHRIYQTQVKLFYVFFFNSKFNRHKNGVCGLYAAWALEQWPASGAQKAKVNCWSGRNKVDLVCEIDPEQLLADLRPWRISQRHDKNSTGLCHAWYLSLSLSQC